MKISSGKLVLLGPLNNNKTLMLISTCLIFFLILYCASYNQYLKSLAQPLGQPVKDEYNELKKVLEEASTSEKTVILTTLNEAWAAPNSIFDLFLESFRIGNNTTWLLKHLVVIAMDEKAYIQCQKLVSHCYFLKTNQSTNMAHDAHYMTPIYLEIMWERLAFLQTILSLGYNIVFTDTDVMWFRNPFPHFTPDSDFQTACDDFNGKEFDLDNNSNNGFLFVQSNNRTVEFYKFWIASRHRYPHLHDQDAFNKIKNETFVKQLGIKLRFLDTDYFGGFCEPSKDFNKVCTMHANCCVGLRKKIINLHNTIKAWKHYYMSSNHSTLQPAQWGVHKHC